MWHGYIDEKSEFATAKKRRFIRLDNINEIMQENKENLDVRFGRVTRRKKSSTATFLENFDRTKDPFQTGSWSREERLLFLIGLRTFGYGRWKKIGTILKSRSNVQIKSHGQKIIRRKGNEEEIFKELAEAEAEGTAPLVTSPRGTTNPTPPSPYKYHSERTFQDTSLSSKHLTPLPKTRRPRGQSQNLKKSSMNPQQLFSPIKSFRKPVLEEEEAAVALCTLLESAEKTRI